jgi:hypothetical protein
LAGGEVLNVVGELVVQKSGGIVAAGAHKAEKGQAGLHKNPCWLSVCG